MTDLERVTRERAARATDAELAVLGAILKRADAAGEAAAVLARDDFGRDAHRRLYEVMAALAARGTPVDPVTVADELRRRGWLEDVGGDGAVMALTMFGGTGWNVEHHANIVREAADVRRVEAAGEAIASAARAYSGPSAALVDEAERAVFALRRRGGKAALPLKAALDAWQDELNARLKGRLGGVEPCLGPLKKIVPGFFPGELVVLAARPGRGKTALALALARGAMGGEAPTPTLFCSLEMSTSQLVERLVVAESRLDARKLREGQLTGREMEDVIQAVFRLGDLKMWVDDAGQQTSSHVAACARRLRAKEGLGLVVVDYVGLMGVADASQRRYEQVAECSGSLKALAKELSIPVLLLAQLSRLAEGETPRLSHLRESGSLEQDADTVIFLHEPDEPGRDEDLLRLIVAKQRSGERGEVDVRFVRREMRFEDPLARVPFGRTSEGGEG